MARSRYQPYRNKRNNPKRRRAVWLIVLVLIAVGVWYFFLREDSGQSSQDSSNQNNVAVDDNHEDTSSDVISIDHVISEDLPVPRDGGEDVMKTSSEEQQAALSIYEKGMQLLGQEEYIQARSMLSRTLLSGALPSEQAKQAREELTQLANKMIFSGRTYDGDEYTMLYTFHEREILAKVERKLDLYVPWRLLLKVNGISRPERIRAGQTLKMIKGPFHGIVYKSEHAMDIYLDRDGLDKIYVKRIPVGLGTRGGTPQGRWRVVNKLVKPDYYPAENSPLKKRRIPYGDPDYAFGNKGLWIGLKGMDPDNRTRSGYGIHSTDKPDSIGKDASEGCIRVGDDDIEDVFAMLYEKRSTVTILP